MFRINKTRFAVAAAFPATVLAAGAYAQSANDTGSKYDSQSMAGNSANWGVGG